MTPAPTGLDERIAAVTLSVVMPAYNEEATIEAAVRRVRECPLRAEIIVVDDASSDGTRAVLESLRAAGLVDTLVLHDVNQGKGCAVRSAIPHVMSEAVRLTARACRGPVP